MGGPAELRRQAQGIYSVEWEQAQGCEWDSGWRDEDAGWCEEWDGKCYWVDEEERTVEVKSKVRNMVVKKNSKKNGGCGEGGERREID